MKKMQYVLYIYLLPHTVKCLDVSIHSTDNAQRTGFVFCGTPLGYY